MDAATGGGWVPPATLGEEHQTRGHAPFEASVRLINPLQRYISLVEHSMPPNSGRCRHCFALFSTSRALRSHINRVHTRDFLFVCDDTACSYRSFGFLAMIAHDRRHHFGRRMFSVGFKQSEPTDSQPALYEVVPLSQVETYGSLWNSADNRQRRRCLPDQVRMNNGSDSLRLFPPISPYPSPGEQGTDVACMGIEGGQAWANNSLDLSQVQRPGIIGWTLLPPASYQSAPYTVCPGIGGGQAQIDIDPVPVRSENRDCAPLPPLPEQGTLGTGEACPGDELTGDFRDIYHTFKQRLESLQPGPSLYV